MVAVTLVPRAVLPATEPGFQRDLIATNHRRSGVESPKFQRPDRKPDKKEQLPEERREGVLAPLLQITDLHTEFRTGAGVVRAVDGISYTVEQGEKIGRAHV